MTPLRRDSRGRYISPAAHLRYDGEARLLPHTGGLCRECVEDKERSLSLWEWLRDALLGRPV